MSVIDLAMISLLLVTESMSSNDHEDASTHVPVIRNSRTSLNNSSGDANIKARQARLARDLSSSRLAELKLLKYYAMVI